MPPAICDSEDEEEILVEDDEPSQRSHGSNRSFGQAVALANEILSGSQGPGEADGSSLSTGEINRQIADTTRGFFSSATDHSKMKDAPASSAKQKLSRRHTNVDGATATKAATPVKRTPTTYGKSSNKSQRSSHPNPDEAFQAYCNDERASQVSISAAFLQPSDSAKATDGLPGGTLLQDFQHHDPRALFPDTGSTIPDNESSTRRMVELAREPRVMPDASLQKLSDESQPQQSSPFVAWSASENQTQTPKLNSDKALPRSVSSAPVDSHDAADTCHDSQHDEPKKISRTKPLAETEASPVQEDVDDASDPKTVGQQPILNPVSAGDEQTRGVDESAKVQLGSHKPRPPPKSSPMVIIPPAEISISEANNDVSKPPRGRKRKSSDEQGADGHKPDSEAMNSDDRAIGLPKELYKPRPSRRRATAMEEPIDYSIIPEKAVKRRRKTLSDERIDDSNHKSQAPLTKATSKTRKQQSDNEHRSSAEVSKTTRHSRRDEDAELDLAIANSLRDMEQLSASKASPTGKRKKSAQPTPTTPRRETQHDPPRPMASPLSPPVSLKDIPSASKTMSTTQQTATTSPTKMLPPSLPASASRKAPRRSQTTIFEDHAASRSPSLSQQQAERLATVKDVPKSTQSNKRKRRTIVQNDEEEEDELAKVSPAKKPAPKKRGRPSKAETAARADASGRALVDVEDEELVVQRQQLGEKAEKRVSTPHPSEADAEDHDLISYRKKSTKRKSSAVVLEDTEDELEAQQEVGTNPQATKKNGRGRPKKTILEDSDAESVLDDENEHSDAQPKKKGPGRPAKAKANGVVASKEQEQSTSAKATPSAALKPKDANANAAARRSGPESKEPTPAPSVEKPATVTATKHTTPAPDVKPSPNSHSPIKKNAKVIHRVGLGRRQRVQPLLKIIRPEAKARKEDATRVTTVTSVAELEKKWNAVEE
ncbi:hypothetical protein CKM354_000485500 [Cercospora kikuchii]|uniref:Uncharacterized protein n=1 Tax=Cercospora kikuchii TaxID=84275 RepID=A0A9P3CJD9_9PEZI|nr:uncharacterized protein CKM354_000485500 [Cercospora kikuchii]GIZ41555.1 hypothetical protein CKM354_000485500 [Cercospora kikuchii]